MLQAESDLIKVKNTGIEVVALPVYNTMTAVNVIKALSTNLRQKLKAL